MPEHALAYIPAGSDGCARQLDRWARIGERVCEKPSEPESRGNAGICVALRREMSASGATVDGERRHHL